MENKKILLVEDEKSISDVLKMKIESTGMNVSVATDGEEGLSKAITEHPDVIVLDLILPRLDGMSVLRNLRNDDWGKSVPVIILSNLGTGDEIQEASSLGVKYFLVKTEFRIEDVVSKIGEILNELKN